MHKPGKFSVSMISFSVVGLGYINTFFGVVHPDSWKYPKRSFFFRANDVGGCWVRLSLMAHIERLNKQPEAL